MSWVALRGRCHRCANPIGVFYPAIEIAALVIALWAATAVSGWQLWVGCVLGWSLLTLAVIDYRHFLLPDYLTLPLIQFGFVATWVNDPSPLGGHIVGAAAGLGFVVVLRSLSAATWSRRNGARRWKIIGGIRGVRRVTGIAECHVDRVYHRARDCVV